MKVEEIRKMSDEELSSELASLKEELFKLRFQLATNQLDNTSQIAQVKRDIASWTLNSSPSSLADVHFTRRRHK